MGIQDIIKLTAIEALKAIWEANQYEVATLWENYWAEETEEGDQDSNLTDISVWIFDKFETGSFTIHSP